MIPTQKPYPYFYKNRFSNYPGEKSESVFWRSMLMFVQSWVARRGNASDLADWITKPDILSPYSDAQPKITWIGHATFLIQISGITIITDPVFGDLSVLFKRITAPGVTLQQLPPIDVILISHNHYDHMDEASLKSIARANPDVMIAVPQGDKKWFDKRGFKRVRECMWWEQFTVQVQNARATLTFLPACHWSQRTLLDRNRSLWGSWMIQAQKNTIYFAGDTAYGKHFSAIAREFPSIDTALMPIGPCEPRKWMKLSHISPEEAGQAFLELGARHFIPMHWGVYWFGTDYPLLPIERLMAWWKQEISLSDKQLHCLKVGQSLIYQQPEARILEKDIISLPHSP